MSIEPLPIEMPAPSKAFGASSGPSQSAGRPASKGSAVSFHHVLRGKESGAHAKRDAAHPADPSKTKPAHTKSGSKSGPPTASSHAKATDHAKKTDHAKSKGRAVVVTSALHIADRAGASSGKQSTAKAKTVPIVNVGKVTGKALQSPPPVGKADSAGAPAKAHEPPAKPVVQVTVQGAPKAMAGSSSTGSQTASNSGVRHQPVTAIAHGGPKVATHTAPAKTQGQATGPSVAAKSASGVKGHTSVMASNAITSPAAATSAPSSGQASQPLPTAQAGSNLNSAHHVTAATAHAPSAKPETPPSQPQGWKIQPIHVQNADGVRQSTWTIRPPVSNGPPMTLELTQQGSSLKANLTVNAAAAALINTAPTVLPHHAVHLPDGVSNLQFTVMTQGGGAGGSGFGGQPYPHQPAPGQLAGAYGGTGGSGLHGSPITRSDAPAELVLSGVDYRA